jgi:FemAB-related protein (PEP-CTERM system-associated)
MSIGAQALTVGVTNPNEAAIWDRYVTSHPDAFGYHEWAWRSTFERVLGHTCLYLAARLDGLIVGVLPLVEVKSLFGRSLTSLPFVNFGGVLANSDDVARSLIGEAAALAASRRCSHVELRHITRRFTDLPCKEHKVTMRLALSSGMWDRLDRKTRNQVRKAQKSELTVDRGGTELVTDFYRVFSRNMRDLGTPVYSRSLFTHVSQTFPDRVRIIVVRHHGLPVAAGLTFRTRGMIEIPWASSIRDYNHLCPNHLLYWHAIETAITDGVETFDFGRSTPHEGTYKFKEQWGAAPLPLHWEYWLPEGASVPDQGPKNPKFAMAIESWKRLPVWLANLVGPRVVRRIP